MNFKPYIISGMCVCGHSWEEHHLGVIMNTEYMDYLDKNCPDHPCYLPGECEHFGSNESGGYDSEGEEHCHQYEDVEHVKDCKCEVCRAWGA